VKNFFVFTLILFLVSGAAYGKGYEARKKLGAYEAGLTIVRNPPVLGENDIEIEIRGAEGGLVTGAKVLVNYYMPPMPRMAPMNYITGAKLKGERYKATLNFIMSGPWIIAVKIDVGGKVSTAKFNVNLQ